MDGPYKDLRESNQAPDTRKKTSAIRQVRHPKMKEMRHHKSDSSWPCWPHLNTAFFVTQQLIYFLSIGHETGSLLGHLFQKSLSRIMSLLRNLQAGLQVFSPTINMHQPGQDCKDSNRSCSNLTTMNYL